MQIKGADDLQADLDALDALLLRPDIDSPVRRRIESELRKLRAGVSGERDAAYEIEFHYGKSQNRVTLHGLRLEVDGRVAQIDHLIINRYLTIWVCESKHFNEGVAVNDHGEWSAFYGRQPYGIESPVAQNLRHTIVLQDVFDQGLVEVPRRLGIRLKPSIKSLVLVSNGARISRPRSKAASEAAGLDHVIKLDQFRTTIERDIDQTSSLALAKAVGSSTIASLGRGLAALHRPVRFDWAAKFGLPVQAPRPEAATPPPTARAASACASCGTDVSRGVARYSEDNADRFGGRILCMPCQRAASA